ncbi:MAG TPA: ATPase [Bacteroidales bacterium]|nr:ATPase [Bacteroidales bacterium]
MIESSPLRIAIASGKGGTGKTFLATNLARLMSQYHKTLLVDLDVEEPNDHVFIHGTLESSLPQYKMIPEWNEAKCTHCGICSSSCAYHAVIQLGTYVAVFKELCHSCHACSELCPAQALPMQPHEIGVTNIMIAENLTFIESQLQVGEEQAVPLIHRTHTLIRENELHDFPIHIYDCPPGTSCPVVAAVRPADFVLLVTEPTPFGLNDLQLAVDTLIKLDKPMGVVINRCDIGNNEVEAYCNRMQIPVISKIPYNRQVAVLYSNGELVNGRVHSATVAFGQIASYIRDNI